VTTTTGVTVTLEATLWHNVDDWLGNGKMLTGTRAHNHWGDPGFAAPDAGDYHLGPSSGAIDLGVDAGVTRDWDGDLRPVGKGYDLGADEFPAALHLTQHVSSNPVQAGLPLTFTIHVTNPGNVNLHAAITDIIPAHVTPVGPRTWSLTLIPSETLTRTIVVTTETGYHGPLTNTVRVTTDEGPHASTAKQVLTMQALTTIDPSVEDTLVTPDGMVTIQFPPGALTETTQLAYTSLPTVTQAPAGFVFAGSAFELDVYRHGALQSSVSFAPPITLTSCSTRDLSELDESTLELRYWNGETWSQDGINVQAVASRCLTATLEHLSKFAVFGRKEQQAPRKVYLPIVLRQYP